MKAAIPPTETIALITAAGGDTEFGKLLGIDHEEGFQQRVNNWRRRGMPSAVVLEHYELIKKLRAQMQRSDVKSRRGAPAGPASS